MTSHTIGISAALLLYFAVMMAIVIFYCRRMHSASDYILGSRTLGAWVTSMSAEAADMSGWLMLGLPGYAYCAGMQAGWIALGLMIGTYINWKAVAGRLRTYTQVANDSLTIPDYLQNRFHGVLHHDTQHWKYIHYLELQGMDELYDLSVDPYGMRNLIDEPGARPALEAMQAELRRMLSDRGEERARDSEAREGARSELR